MNRAGHFIIYVFGPLFKNGKWLIWFLFIIIFMMFSNAINAFLMHIPTEDEVIKIKGRFIDTSKRYVSRTGYDIRILSNSGKEYSCGCDPLSNSNCLGRHLSDHALKLNELNKSILEKGGPHKALIRFLDNKYGEVWMYENRNILRTRFSCYKIADANVVYRSYERSVEEYTKYKNSLLVLISVAIITLTSIFLIGFILSFTILRSINFIRETPNGQCKR